jgi:hypothetical protein
MMIWLKRLRRECFSVSEICSCSGAWDLDVYQVINQWLHDRCRVPEFVGCQEKYADFSSGWRFGAARMTVE